LTNLNIRIKTIKNVKRYYYLAIPAAITVIVVFYALNFHENNSVNNSNQVSPQALMENGSPLLGDPGARITIVEFGDYQCTYCHAFHQNTKDQLIQDYINTGKVNFVFRDFPLNGPASVLAAQAAYCAGDQNKYWQYHDELYNNWGGENTGWVNQKSLDQFANNVNLDLTEFDTCISDKKYEQKVMDNQQFGTKLGVNATPSFIIFSDKKVITIVGAQPYSVFKQALDNI
jgi:protein-disulfide isomerase